MGIFLSSQVKKIKMDRCADGMYAAFFISGLVAITPTVSNATLFGSGSAIPNQINTTAKNVNVGVYSQGTLTLNSNATGNGISRLDVNSVNVGEGAGSNGTLNVTGNGIPDSASIIVNSNNYSGVVVANGGTGTLNITNGGGVYANETNILLGGGDPYSAAISQTLIDGMYSVLKTNQSLTNDRGGRINIGNGSGTLALVGVTGGGHLEAIGAHTGDDSYDDGSIWIGANAVSSDALVSIQGAGSKMIASDYIGIGGYGAGNYSELSLESGASVTVTNGRDDYEDISVASSFDNGNAEIFIGGNSSLNATDIGIDGNGLIYVENTGRINASVVEISGHREFYNTKEKAVLHAKGGSLVNGDVNVHDNGMLKGSGTINGDVTVFYGGTLSPGNSPGTINIVGDLILDGGRLELEIDSDDYYDMDRINVTGDIYVDGDVQFDIILNYLPTGTISVSSFFTGFSKLMFDDLFNPITNIDILGLAGQAVDLDYFGQIYTYTENGAFLKNVNPVPEPTTLFLFGTGLAGFMYLSRRRQ